MNVKINKYIKYRRHINTFDHNTMRISSVVRYCSVLSWLFLENENDLIKRNCWPFMRVSS